MIDRRKNQLYFIVVILLLTFFAFSPVLKNGFINWDDPHYIINNHLIKSFSVDNLKEIFSTQLRGNYHPLTVLSYAVEYHFFKLNPTVYHFTNLLFHVFNIFLVFYFIVLLTGKNSIAFITAVLFAIHPMRVESVAWASERKDVLYVFFFLIALICYLLYQKKNLPKYYWLALLFFLCSILSKAMAVSLSPVLLMINYYSGRKFNKQTFLDTIPFFALSLIFGIIAIKAQQSFGALENYPDFSIGKKLLIASYGYIIYLYKLIVPINLSHFYPYPPDLKNKIPLVFSVTPFIIPILWFFIYKSLRFGKEIIFGFLFHFFTVIMVLQLMSVGNTIMTDRFSYLSYVGIFFVLGKVYEILISSKSKFLLKIKFFIPILGLLLILLLSYMTYERCKIWGDEFSLWSDNAKKYPNAHAFTNLGVYYKNQGNYPLSLQYYNQAIALEPGFVYPYENRGNLFVNQQKYSEAMKDFNLALNIKPTSEYALNGKGIIFGETGQYDSAIYYFSKAIEANKDFWKAYQNRGKVYIFINRFEPALNDYTVFLKNIDNDAKAYYWRGIIYHSLEKYNKAINDFTTSLLINPRNGETYFARSHSYQATGQFQKALEDAMMAKSLGKNVDDTYLQVLKNK